MHDWQIAGTFLCFALMACGGIEVTVPPSEDVAAAVQICVVNSQRCNSKGDVDRCNAEGTAFLFAAECKTTEVCDGGVCAPKEACVTGDQRCSGDLNATLTCQGGKWRVTDDCWGGLCTNGACP